MTRFRNLALALALAVGGGCQKAAPPPAAASGLPDLPTQAQPKLATVRLWLGAEEMATELAATPAQVQTGMMFRTNMAENESMLFDLSYSQRASFWMPNCPLPLSVAYINTEGVIEEIHDLQPFDTNSVFSAVDNVRFALETRQGWFQRHHVNPGVVIKTERGTLMETFSGRWR
jgi:uncharacterized membrane protein (UPF0127 family)